MRTSQRRISRLSCIDKRWNNVTSHDEWIPVVASSQTKNSITQPHTKHHNATKLLTVNVYCQSVNKCRPHLASSVQLSNVESATTKIIQTELHQFSIAAYRCVLFPSSSQWFWSRLLGQNNNAISIQFPLLNHTSEITDDDRKSESKTF